MVPGSLPERGKGKRVRLEQPGVCLARGTERAGESPDGTAPEVGSTGLNARTRRSISPP